MSSNCEIIQTKISHFSEICLSGTPNRAMPFNNSARVPVSVFPFSSKMTSGYCLNSFTEIRHCWNPLTISKDTKSKCMCLNCWDSSSEFAIGEML